MPGTSVGVAALRGVAGEVAAAIRQHEHEFLDGRGKVTLMVYLGIGTPRIELLRPRVLAGAPAVGQAAPSRLPADIQWLADEVHRRIMLNVSTAVLPKQLVIDIFLRGPRPTIEIKTKS